MIAAVYMGFPARPSLSAVDSSLTSLARLGHLERSTLQYVPRVQPLKATKSYAHRYSPLLGYTTGSAQKLKFRGIIFLSYSLKQQQNS